MSRKKTKNKPAAAAAPAPEKKTEPAAPRKSFDLFLLVMLLIAAFVRFIHLGKAQLWQDELGYIPLANSSLSVGQILSSSWDLILTIGQMPLSFVVCNLSFKLIELFTGTIGPFTPALARLPSAVFGIVSVWAVYKLASRVLDVFPARLVTVLMAVSFFPVYYTRELYSYAQIIMVAPLAVWLVVETIYGAKSTLRLVLSTLCLTALLYLHLGALMLVVMLSLCVLIVWARALKTKDMEIARSAFRAGLSCAAALLLASPYVLRFVLYNEAHTSGADYSFFVILNDAVSKLFLGERIWASAVSWFVLAAGMASLLMPHAWSRERKLVAWTALLGLLAIAWATERSQYLSARYFSPVAPLIILVSGQGVYQIGVWIASLLRLPEAKRRIVYLLVAALPVGMHVFVYLPGMMQLTQKSVPFGAMARWVNENLEPGVPYLLESAYEIRWVGQSFPTPNNTPAAPYVHGNHPSELARLHERQIDFMTRFPEAPFIESAHHNWNTPEGVWDWPRRNFRQHELIGNPEKTKDLIRLGIFPGLPHEKITEYSYRVDVYYNTLEDRIAIARESDNPVITNFRGWEVQGQRTSQQETMYFRLQRGASGGLTLINAGDENVSGTLALTLVSPGQSARLQFGRGGQVLHRVQVPADRANPVNVPVNDLPPGETRIEWASQNPIDGLIVLDAVWSAVQ